MAEPLTRKFHLGQVVFERDCCYSRITGFREEGGQFLYFFDGDSSDPVPESACRELTIEEMFG